MSDTEKTLDAVRVPTDLRQIGGLTAQQAGPSVEAFFHANKDRLSDLVAGIMRPERLLKVAQTAIRTTPGLRQCTVASLFGAVVVCAIMGLEPNTHEGLCWLIPRKSSRPRRNAQGVIMTDNRGGFIWDEVWEVNVQVGYKGHIALAYRNPRVKMVHTAIIHENDDYQIIEGTDPRIEHRPLTHGDRGDAIIYYAICKLDTGETLFEWMSRGQVERIRDTFSDAYASADSKRSEALAIIDRGGDGKAVAKAKRDLEKAEAAPWIRDFDQMARKTLINRLRNYIPSGRQSSLAAAIDAKDMLMRSQRLDRVLDTGDLGNEDDDYDAAETEPARIVHEQTVGMTIDDIKPKDTVKAETTKPVEPEKTKPSEATDLAGSPAAWFDDLTLSGRARAAARKGAEYGAVTLEQAAAHPREWWLDLPGVGEAAYAQIEVAIKAQIKEAKAHAKPVEPESEPEPGPDPERKIEGGGEPSDAAESSGFGDPT